ncbi:50S ribosomal protein L28 [Candidatus Saccharibacteria bacterium]|nr:50S ribosomal protein L28 [Candidatus Saccharibacteria bacterium]
MAQKCDITGKGKMYGHNVSHSMRATNRAWKPNLQTKTLVIDGQKVRLKLAASTIRTLKKYERQLETESAGQRSAKVAKKEA